MGGSPPPSPNRYTRGYFGEMQVEFGQLYVKICCFFLSIGLFVITIFVYDRMSERNKTFKKLCPYFRAKFKHVQ